MNEEVERAETGVEGLESGIREGAKSEMGPSQAGQKLHGEEKFTLIGASGVVNM